MNKNTYLYLLIAVLILIVIAVLVTRKSNDVESFRGPIMIGNKHCASGGKFCFDATPENCQNISNHCSVYNTIRSPRWIHNSHRRNVAIQKCREKMNEHCPIRVGNYVLDWGLFKERFFLEPNTYLIDKTIIEKIKTDLVALVNNLDLVRQFQEKQVNGSHGNITPSIQNRKHLPDYVRTKSINNGSVENSVNIDSIDYEPFTNYHLNVFITNAALSLANQINISENSMRHIKVLGALQQLMSRFSEDPFYHSETKLGGENYTSNKIILSDTRLNGAKVYDDTTHLNGRPKTSNFDFMCAGSTYFTADCDKDKLIEFIKLV